MIRGIGTYDNETVTHARNIYIVVIITIISLSFPLKSRIQ